MKKNFKKIGVFLIILLSFIGILGGLGWIILKHPVIMVYACFGTGFVSASWVAWSLTKELLGD